MILDEAADGLPVGLVGDGRDKTDVDRRDAFENDGAGQGAAHALVEFTDLAVELCQFAMEDINKPAKLSRLDQQDAPVFLVPRVVPFLKRLHPTISASPHRPPSGR